MTPDALGFTSGAVGRIPDISLIPVASRTFSAITAGGL